MIDEDEAQERLGEDGVAEEIERIENLRNATESTLQHSSLEGDRMQEPRVIDGPTQETAKNKTNSAVLSRMSSLKAGETDEISTLNSLRSLGDLPKSDYDYIVAFCGNSYPKIKKWAKRMLSAE